MARQFIGRSGAIYGKVAAWLLGGLISFNATLIQAAPQDGWWWNPNEGGRGFFLEVQGPRMFMSGYFYGDDGRATWLVSNDPMPNPAFYQGNLLAFGNGQSLLGDYRAPGAPSVQGTVTLQFTDDTHAVMTWPGGVVPIERYNYRSGITAFQPKNGWWWNPQESGRGFSIELQGNHMFIGAYMYDGNGNPIWYAADALMESPNVFRAPLLQFGNGQTLTGAYRAPTSPAVVGTLTVQFSAANQATVTLSDEKSFAKQFKTFTILPLFELVVPGPSAKLWSGYYDYTRNATITTLVNKYTVEADVVNWTQPVDLDTGSYPAFYKIESGFAVVSVLQTSDFCVIEGSKGVDLKDGDLTVNAGGSYTGKITGSVTFPVTETCTLPGQQTTVLTVQFTQSFDLRMTGNLDAGGRMKGDVPNNSGIPFVVESGSWNFHPTF
jgi:hypothetical protein